MAEYKLQFADLEFYIYTKNELELDDALHPFLSTKAASAGINISISWETEAISMSEFDYLGEDLLCSYYRMDETCYCAVKNGTNGAFAWTVYDNSMKHFRFIMQVKSFLEAPQNLGAYLRLLPLREIFTHYGILFFHSAQISLNNKGILFAAPSGTGKTTQANLWKEYRGAEIVCNDRTLVRKVGDKWYTYGFPIDGSEPVRSGEVNELGCIVLLEQAKENCVQSLGVAKAVAGLMPQLVLDTWNKEEQIKIRELLFSLLESHPVMALSCTPDDRAVTVLEEVLVEKGIIADGINI